ncbi:cation-transporting P-type ATPase [soil metagenome]
MTPGGSDTNGSNHHYGLPAHEVILLLETDPHAGLTTTEAARRFDSFGANELPITRRAGPVLRMLRQLQNPLIYILLAAGATTFALREYVDSAVILGVVVVNAIVGFIQESKAEASLDALRSMVSTRARIVRDGGELQVDSRELVPGDLVLIEAGDKVAADLRIVATSGLEADESALTGESLPVTKDDVVLPDATAVADRRNMLYSGTLITTGSGAGVAVETGASTELGHIHRLVGSADSLATPLTRKLAHFSKVLTIVILGLAAVTFVVGVARGRDASDTFTAAVALAVGAIPEGLPAAVTITLAIGVSRMARRGAVVRRMPAVETLGSTTVICSDKTGTLTQNQMTVRTVWTPDQVFSVSGTGYTGSGGVQDPHGAAVHHTDHPALHWCLVGGLACNDATLVTAKGGTALLGDPTEGAMLAVARKAGVERADIAEQFPRTATIPFSSDRQFMATVHHDRTAERYVVFVKGAVERILELSGAQMSADGAHRPVDAATAHVAATTLASEGLRVLATAMCVVEGPDAVSDRDLAGRLVLTGFQAMLDPPRPAARSAVEACRNAGIQVKMITGDHARTATAIAVQVGLLRDNAEPGDVLTGRDLEALDDDAYPDAVSRATVFARVTPEQKLRLVRALQSRNNVVAMTGDGVNDAPALQQADIGIAMGTGGTEVAKEAAAMVLTDDDFATIEAAVEEGRGVFDNLTKFIVWTLPTNMGEGLVILVAILAGGLLMPLTEIPQGCSSKFPTW